MIPTYNRHRSLRHVLSGLAEQTYPVSRFEVIVVVDGSPDGTREMLDTVRTPLSLRIVYQERSGPAGARNTGIAAALGRSIVFLDDDVLPEPTLVGAHAAVHAADEWSVVIGRVTPCCGSTRPGWERWEDYIAERDYRHLEKGGGPVNGSYFYTWNVSVGRALLDRVGGFDPSLAFQEDVDLGFRLEEARARFHYARDAVGQHCGHRPTFVAWRRRHYRFGYYRTIIQRRGSTGLLRSLRDSVDDYHPVTQALLRLTIGRQRNGQIADGLARAGAVGFDLCRLWPLSRLCYSALAISSYWHGVEAATGDRDRLRQDLFAATSRPGLVDS